jgi:hypothetical protein
MDGASPRRFVTNLREKISTTRPLAESWSVGRYDLEGMETAIERPQRMRPPAVLRTLAGALFVVLAVSSCGGNSSTGGPSTTAEPAASQAGQPVTADPTLSDQVTATVEAATVTGPRSVLVSVFVTDCTALASVTVTLTDTELQTSALTGRARAVPANCGDPHLVSTTVRTKTDIGSRTVVLGTQP